MAARKLQIRSCNKRSEGSHKGGSCVRKIGRSSIGVKGRKTEEARGKGKKLGKHSLQITSGWMAHRTNIYGRKSKRMITSELPSIIMFLVRSSCDVAIQCEHMNAQRIVRTQSSRSKQLFYCVFIYLLQLTAQHYVYSNHKSTSSSLYRSPFPSCLPVYLVYLPGQYRPLAGFSNSLNAALSCFFNSL